MNSSFNVRNFLFSIKRNLFFIIIITTLMTLFGIFFGYVVYKQKHLASAEVIVKLEKQNEEDISYDPTQSLKLVQSISDFIKTDLVINSTINKHNLEIDKETLKDNLEVLSSSNSIFIKIEYTHTDSSIARLVATSISQEAVEIAKRDYPIIGNIINGYSESKFVEEIGPSPITFVILGSIIGIILSIGIFILLEFLKTSISDKLDLENTVTKYPVIGVVPYIDGGSK